MQKITILIHCKDQKAIIASVTNYIAFIDGNIIYLDQHVDANENVFFMRLECEFNTKNWNIEAIKNDFQATLASPFNMSWAMYTQDEKPKMALFVSKYDHCLYDILGRHSAGELPLEIPLIISNHEDLKPVADRFNIPFHYVPFTKDTKAEGEQKQLDLLKQYTIDFIVLARYMQIITPKLIAQYPNQIINIHHSFLPAFPGAKPYHSAFMRGVKIIGATSHYVTEELDEGPIIEQDITRVTHSHSIENFIMKGRDLERTVLARAIKLHAERKTIVYDNKTIVFL
ncbi:formyltetrahydrofolate deformylase [Flavobacterium sp. LS1P28]|uniref:formyltetrahydrofolate deformylase n=1 Tax=unclassified Flavobacterium TaxID=196869 RepID=UPI000F83E8D4|nr:MULTISPECIES: formyltetrahydrofolate deformylase [unclassified Flavobacterium]RTY65283.1 formyltetrahydrofolate deformylase [Flavobacterium sp. LB2P53]RTY74154.1 formyltetrahydrofolate deformylase [Flavobacterium sp. LS1R10]RTY83566.1 formyltetrahydrofolate deformylase [Flavobacterium sp. LS1P28]RTY90993.1 formyltetrahydrofolate deformylase [Flavobacterium sp. RSP46]